jgi:hypothetical protein
MSCKVLLPLKSKNYNLHTEEDNFLQYFKHEKICIMDNHRLAFWSWLNFINADDLGKCAYVHIDDHFDCGAKENIVKSMASRMKKRGMDYYRDLDSFRNDTIGIINEDTRNKNGTANNLKTFDWGRYLLPAIFYNFFDNRRLYFFVKQDKSSYSRGGLNDKCLFNGRIPKIKYFENKKISELEKVFEIEDNIILNIDFDYFSDFINSPEVIRNYFLLIKKIIKK